MPLNSDFVHIGDTGDLAEALASDQEFADLFFDSLTNSIADSAIFKSNFTKIISPRKYGATPYGELNDPAVNRAAFQAAIDEASNAAAFPNPVTTVRNATVRIEIPEGIWFIDAPLVFRSVIGIEFIGRGKCEIRATANMSSMLDINGAAYSRFGGFLLTGAAGVQVDNGIWTYHDPAGSARSNTANSYFDIWIANLNYIAGIRVGDLANPTTQVDNDEYRNIVIHGTWVVGEVNRWQYGFYLGAAVSSNNLLHHLYHINVVRNRFNLYVSTTQCALYGAGFGYAESDIFVGGTAFNVFSGIRSENSKRFLTTSGPATSYPMISISDVLWYGSAMHADGYWMKFFLGGTLVGRSISAINMTVIPKIQMGSAAPCRGLFDGFAVGGSVGNPGPFTVQSCFTLAGAASVSVRGYVAGEVGGGVILPIKDWDSSAPAILYEAMLYNGVSTTTWNKPTWATTVEMILVPGTSGSGSGRRGAPGTVRCGGGASAGGSITRMTYDADDLPAQLSVSAGAAGVGGAAVALDDTNGNNGTIGGGSFIRSMDLLTTYARADGGIAGSGGTALTGLGGLGGKGLFPGGVGAPASTTGLVGVAGTDGQGCGGGGSGGGLSAANVESAGGNGGYTSSRQSSNLNAGGAIGVNGVGSNNGPVAPNSIIPVNGTGGGGSKLGGIAGSGGIALSPGAGCGGGGASENGYNSGAGASGPAGRVIIISRG